MTLDVRWLGRVPYREAWDLQHGLVADRAAGRVPDTLLLLEHPRVLTLGRHASEDYVLAADGYLSASGIEVIRVERGGEVTYHGPGQLVAYPIVRLGDRGLLVRPFVRLLEAAMTETAADYGVPAARREGFPGVWCDAQGPLPRKLGALGLRIEQDVSYHGIALNVTTDLADFDLIVPCGLPSIGVTSIAREAGWPPERSVPSTRSVAEAGARFAAHFARLLDSGAYVASDAFAGVGQPGAPGPVGRPSPSIESGSATGAAARTG
ncbi:MAG: lipoyl(octanoyl) transferase LipB [Candidatus Limnocylindrales bacterium]